MSPGALVFWELAAPIVAGLVACALVLGIVRATRRQVAARTPWVPRIVVDRIRPERDAGMLVEQLVVAREAGRAHRPIGFLAGGQVPISARWVVDLSTRPRLGSYEVVVGSWVYYAPDLDGVRAYVADRLRAIERDRRAS